MNLTSTFIVNLPVLNEPPSFPPGVYTMYVYGRYYIEFDPKKLDPELNQMTTITP